MGNTGVAIPAGYRFYKSLIEKVAGEFSLDPLLVAAVVWQESAFNTDGFRHEPDFWNRYLKPKKIWQSQNPRRVSSSYGLMQVMYPLLFEDKDPSNDGDAPETLFVPEKGLRAGCGWLRGLIDWSNRFPNVPEPQRLRAALAAYNGGRGGNTPGTALRPINGRYADQVLAKLSLLQKAGA